MGIENACVRGRGAVCVCVCVSLSLSLSVYVYICLFVSIQLLPWGLRMRVRRAYAGEEPFLILPSRLFSSPFFSPSPSYTVSSYLNRLARKFLPSNTCVCRFLHSPAISSSLSYNWAPPPSWQTWYIPQGCPGISRGTKSLRAPRAAD